MNTTHENHTKINQAGELTREYGERLFIGPLPASWYDEIDHPQWPQRPMVCSYCSIRPTLKIASGTPECTRCWNWRKLDGPAARHWLKVSTLFVSNIDAYDYLTFFPKTLGFDKGMRDIDTMFSTAVVVQKKCFALVEEHTSTEHAVELCNIALEPFNLKLTRHPVTEELLEDS